MSFLAIFLILNIVNPAYALESVTANNFTVSFDQTYGGDQAENICDGFTTFCYNVSIQNLLGTPPSGRDFNLSAILFNLSFSGLQVSDIKIYEYKNQSYNKTTYVESCSSNPFIAANSSTEPNVTCIPAVIFESASGNFLKEINLVTFEKNSTIAKRRDKIINIPKFGSKESGDTFNGTKYFKLVFKVPILQLASIGLKAAFGTRGSYGIQDSDQLYHPGFLSGFSRRVEINLSQSRPLARVLLNLAFLNATYNLSTGNDVRVTDNNNVVLAYELFTTNTTQVRLVNYTAFIVTNASNAQYFIYWDNTTENPASLSVPGMVVLWDNFSTWTAGTIPPYVSFTGPNRNAEVAGGARPYFRVTGGIGGGNQLNISLGYNITSYNATTIIQELNVSHGMINWFLDYIGSFGPAQSGTNRIPQMNPANASILRAGGTEVQTLTVALTGSGTNLTIRYNGTTQPLLYQLWRYNDGTSVNGSAAGNFSGATDGWQPQGNDAAPFRNFLKWEIWNRTVEFYNPPVGCETGTCQGLTVSSIQFANRAPLVNSISLNASAYVNSSVFNFNITVNATDEDGESDISNVTFDIINPNNSVNMSNRTMTQQSLNLYAFSYHTNSTEGNWTLRAYVRDAAGLIGTRVTTFVIDLTNPTPTIGRTNSMAGILRGGITSITLNFNDSYATNWTLTIYNSSGSRQVDHNGSANTTFQFNSTSSSDAGNWSLNFTARDLARNSRTVSDWFGLASVAVADERRWEPGNFTSTADAWGNVTAITNNSAIDFDYLRVIRFTWNGVCANCSTTSQFNVSTNFTGTWRFFAAYDSDNATINFTVTAGNITNLTSDQENLTGNGGGVADRIQESRMRIRVPNAWLFLNRPDANGVQWTTIALRNVTENIRLAGAYVRFNPLSTHIFNGQLVHPRYNWCSGTPNGTAVPPTCGTLATQVDLNDANNGANGIIDLFVDGPSTARNIWRARVNMSSDFLFRTTIENGGMVANTDPAIVGGGGGGVFAAVQTLAANITNATALASLPPLESSLVAKLSIALIVGGILFALSQAKTRTKKKKEWYDV